jgi:surface polysaccharide O-acyltransferase-like enzyme
MDLLRILACVMVVLIHVSSQNWYSLTPESPDWQALNIYDSMARPAVPLFLMLSGAFMLAPEKRLGTNRLWLRYIPRLAGAYALWSFVYSLYELTGALTDFSGLTFTAVVRSAVVGQYHLWYLPVIIMLYILIPVLRAALHGDGGRRRCEYLLLILLAYGTLKATVLCFDFPGQLCVRALADKFSFGALSAYAGYFILGYYLYRYSLPRAAQIALYILGFCSAPVTAFATYMISVRSGAPDDVRPGVAWLDH